MTKTAGAASRAVLSWMRPNKLWSALPAGATVKMTSKLEILKNREDFLACARARRRGTSGMMVQARKRDETGSNTRVGFTCSKKVGNAVARNRAKRRLREVARLVLPTYGRPGWDYVLIGRSGTTAARPFAALQEDLVQALERLHAN